MYDAATRAGALARLARGESLRSICLDTGINRSTLREWRARNGCFAPRIKACRCPACDDSMAEVRVEYLYLLGQYLGDGSIQRAGRGHVLRVYCCDTYPTVMDEVEIAMKAVVGGSVFRVSAEGCTVVQSNTNRWLHLLPQHGPGMKHTRPIVLEPWQRELVAADPRPLIRGLIHSDGCRVTNWTDRQVGGTTKRYTYPRYFFSNVSDDIRGIFTGALDLLGIAWKQNNWNSISVARREAVAALDEFVGPKT
ncbi:MAG TPA: hypothetical protein VFT62_01310 [Mycobacteriales bacterium]|nr:hypothetical protein [Mycobacteriales bacterium]